MHFSNEDSYFLQFSNPSDIKKFIQFVIKKQTDFWVVIYSGAKVYILFGLKWFKEDSVLQFIYKYSMCVRFQRYYLIITINNVDQRVYV